VIFSGKPKIELRSSLDLILRREQSFRLLAAVFSKRSTHKKALRINTNTNIIINTAAAFFSR